MIDYGNKHLTVRAIKMAVDGALGSRGAWFLAPYSDLVTSSGLGREKELENARIAAQLAIDNGYQLCLHAIGDRANREVLNIYEEAFKKNNGNGKDLRWRVEHAQHIHRDDIPRFGRLGVIAAMQGIHATSDAPYVIARLGAERAEEGAYVWQKLMKSGATVVNGTDAPVEDVDPIASYYATVTRKLENGTAFLPRSEDVAHRGPEVLHAVGGATAASRRTSRDHSPRQARRHHGALEGHHDGTRRPDPPGQGRLHDRGRQSRLPAVMDHWFTEGASSYFAGPASLSLCPSGSRKPASLTLPGISSVSP